LQVRADLETKAGKKFAEFVAIEYSTQVVAGTNYFVKVRLLMHIFKYRHYQYACDNFDKRCSGPNFV